MVSTELRLLCGVQTPMPPAKIRVRKKDYQILNHTGEVGKGFRHSQRDKTPRILAHRRKGRERESQIPSKGQGHLRALHTHWYMRKFITTYIYHHTVKILK